MRDTRLADVIRGAVDAVEPVATARGIRLSSDVANDIGPSVGINFDICNSAFIKEDVPAAIKLLGKRIKNVHISDSTFAV